MRFTKQVVEALPLPPHGSGKLYWDDALKGFGVKVNAGGSRQWIAQYRSPDGRTQRITIGRVDTILPDDARKQAKLILAKAQTGSDPQAEKAETKRQASITLGSVTDSYLDQARGRLKPRSFAEVERSLRKQWKPLAALPIASIRRADVASHLNKLAEPAPVGAPPAEAAESAQPVLGRTCLRSFHGRLERESLKRTPSMVRTSPPMKYLGTAFLRKPS